MVHRELHVAVAVLMNLTGRRIVRGLIPDVEVDGAMREDDIARILEGVMAVIPIENTIPIMPSAPEPRERIWPHAVMDHIDVRKAAGRVVADPAAHEEDHDIGARG